MLIPVNSVLLRALLDAGVPVDTVSIGDPAIRTTWRVTYQSSATTAQRTQGDQILAAFDPLDPTIVAEIKADMAAGLTGQDMLIALGQTAYECAQAPANFPTLLSFRQRFMALLKARL